MSLVQRRIAHAESINALEIARAIECVSPDSDESPGGAFLINVRDAVVDAVRRGEFRDRDAGDVIFELVDGCIPAASFARTEIMVDLGLIHDDTSEAGGGTLIDVITFLIDERGSQAAKVIIDRMNEVTDD